MTVKITKPALNLREELASLRNQGSAYEESKFYIGNLVTNGTFDSDTSGWTGVTSTTSHVNGKLRYTSTGNSSEYPKVKASLGTLQAGSTYVLTVGEHSQVSGGGNVRASIGGDYTGTGQGQGSLLYNASSVSNFSVNVTIDTTQEYFLWLYSQDNGVVKSYEIDNISVYEVAPNLVTNGTFDSDVSGWTGSDAGSTLSYQAGELRIENGDATAAGANRSFAVTAGVAYTLSFDSAVGTASTAGVQFGIGSATNSFNRVLKTDTTNGKHSLTFVAGATTTYYFMAKIRSVTVGEYIQIDNIVVTQGNHHLIHSTPYGYEVKDVYIDGDLAREGEAYDYTVHDGFIQPTIEPTATTETCLIGVRK